MHSLFKKITCYHLTQKISIPHAHKKYKQRRVIYLDPQESWGQLTHAQTVYTRPSFTFLHNTLISNK